MPYQDVQMQILNIFGNFLLIKKSINRIIVEKVNADRGAIDRWYRKGLVDMIVRYVLLATDTILLSF